MRPWLVFSLLLRTECWGPPGLFFCRKPTFKDQRRFKNVNLRNQLQAPMRMLTLDKLPKLFVFPLLITPNGNDIFLLELLESVSEVKCVKHFAWYLARSKHSIHVGYYYYVSNLPLIYYFGGKEREGNVIWASYNFLCDVSFSVIWIFLIFPSIILKI